MSLLWRKHLRISLSGDSLVLAAYERGLRPGKPKSTVAPVRGNPNDPEWRAAVDALRARGLPLVVCTIYDGNYPDPTIQRIRATALTVFNDAILRLAIERALPVIDLRFVCSEPADYANPIEPSSVGGAKIVTAILGTVGVTAQAPCAQIAKR